LYASTFLRFYVQMTFIAFEGIEGAGKSTQIRMLAERLRKEGRDPLVVREPGGTRLAEAARDLVLHGEDDVSPAAELFLYLVARADLVSRVIRPALAAGRVVIADRFELSTRCYQVAGRGLPEAAVVGAIQLATGGLTPDLYIILDLPVEDGRRRQKAQGKSPDRLERAETAFHDRVAAAFRAATGPNVVHVAGGGAPDEVAEQVWKAVSTLHLTPSE
jgi:dTMP kinase